MKITLAFTANEQMGLYKDGERVCFFQLGDDLYFPFKSLAESFGAEFESINLPDCNDDISPEKIEDWKLMAGETLEKLRTNS